MLRYIFTIFTFAFLATACVVDEGPIGPPGLDGRDGLDGLDGLNGEEAYTFEFEVDFISPDFSAILPLPSDFTMLDSDVALVYALWGEENGLEIWRQLPQSIFTLDGIVQYNYDFTTADISVFMEADHDLNILGPSFKDDFIIRVVVIPAQFQNGRTTNNYSDYYKVIEDLGITYKPVDSKYKNITRPAI